MILDILYDDNGLFVEDGLGDFALADAGSALVEDILVASQGHFKEFPSLGINIRQFLNSNINPQIVSRDISVGLRADVFKLPVIDMSEYPSIIKVDNLVLQVEQEKPE